MNVIVDGLHENEVKFKTLENFIALSLRRNIISDDARKVCARVEEVMTMLNISHEIARSELDNVLAKQKKVMQNLRQKQAVLLDYIFAERRRKIRDAEKDDTRISSSSACKLMLPGFEKMNLHQGAITPKMTIYDYKQSPMVKQKFRLNPVPFTFLEFDLKITPQEFEAVPKYMRGRETIGELNNFLGTIIIPCFNEKYQLLHRQRQTLQHASDLELWKVYNSQVALLPGRHFITLDDISRSINKIIDKKQHNRIVMLRHIGVLQQERVMRTVCYIWNANCLKL